MGISKHLNTLTLNQTLFPSSSNYLTGQGQYFFPCRPGQGKPACPLGKQVLKKSPQLGLTSFNSTMKIHRHLNNIPRGAIGSFGRAGRSAKGLRPSAVN